MIILIFIIIIISMPRFQISAGQEFGESIVFRCALEKIQNTNPLMMNGANWKILGLIYDRATRYNSALMIN